MKNKSSNHKSFNRFKFTPFAERVSGIDIRHTALYHLEHANVDNPIEDETYFHNTIQKWRVLNLTAEYTKFSRRVGGIYTLAQLLHRKDEVVDLLIENIETGNILTLQPLLELIVVFAKDLQEDFYPYFPRILKTLISLLNTKDTEQLEWTLVCLAFLFKSLKSYLKRDILVVFEAVLPLLSDSVPWYIKNFAAESFAFVARDIKDKKKFLRALIKTVAHRKDGIVGCGRLLFEIMRGVNKQFHSSAKPFLELLLENLSDVSINQTVYFEILTQTLSDMLQVIHSKYSEIFWSTILNCAASNPTSIQSDDSKALEATIRLVGQALEYENGSFLTNPTSVIVLVDQLLESSAPENVINVTSKLCVLLLISKSTNIPHEDSVRLVKRVLTIPYESITINFVQEVISSPCFDIIILPNFILRIEEINIEIIRVLSQICVKKTPLSKRGIDLYSWVKYPIDFSSKTEKVCDELIKNINEDIESIVANPDRCISSLICLPHIKSLNAEKVERSVEKLLSQVIAFIKHNKNKDLSEEEDKLLINALFILCVVLESAIHTMNINDFEKCCITNDFMDALLSYACTNKYVCSLRALDLYLTACHRQKNLDLSHHQTLYTCIDVNLKSPFREMRLLTSHIFSLFEEKIQKLKNNKNEYESGKEKIEIFSLCFSIESVSPSMEDYRDQLMSLSKMAYGTIQHQLAVDAGFETFPLKYALGMLHVNFKLLWDPIKSFLKSYAKGMLASQFWEVFYPSLKNATTNARKKVDSSHYKDVFSGSVDFLSNVFVEFCELSDNPDFPLYRIHLWEVLQEASALSETKNRDITPLLMDFMSVEFEKSSQGNVFVEESEDMDIEEDRSMDVDVDAEKEDESKGDESNKLTKSTYDTFIAILKVYTNIQNPKAMYMESTLKNLYLEYLMHKNPIIQKIALDCLMKYKNKHWTPYKENLYNLVDGKKFKDELRTFKIQVDEDGIKPDDRDELIPIILRITFSKMITNMGIDKKGGSQLRKSLVVRFLFGCEETELISFTNMAFSVFKMYLNLEISQLPQIVSQTIDQLVNVPPKKILGALQLVDTMREQFTRPGQEKLMLHLLKIVLCIGCSVNGILTQPKKLQSGYCKILKEIRNRCILSISRFLQQFESYEWCYKDNILPVYDVFVWPVIEKLPTEGIYSPTALLKLFSVCSQYPQYHSLLNVFKNFHNFTPLHFTIQLLKNPKIHHTVNEMCIQIIERLLTLETEENRQIIKIPHQYCVPVDAIRIANLELKEKLNYGSSILLPHTNTIVDILQQKFNKHNVKKMQKRDFLILSRVTELVYDTDVVDKLLNFSLPILISRIGQNTAEDTLQSSIYALSTLLGKSAEPVKYIRLLTPLFSQVVPAAPRITLCKALGSLGENEDKIQDCVSIIKDMNAPDEKWIDQPDFEKRISGFKRLYELLDKMEISADLGALVFHNCFFTIRHSTDLSLRNMATSCLQKIAPKLVIQYKDSLDKDYLIKDTILLLIKKGLKVENEVMHMESIALLGELVRECSQVGGVFSELHPLTNKIDKEIDFFENLQHLQFHRRIRAFQKFSNYVKGSKDVPSNRTLTQIIIPLASHYICSEKHLPKHALVDAAVDTIGAICRLLPWRQFEAILKFYVDKLHKASSFQKQLIKIVCVVLDAFHFDLSKVSSADLTNEMVVEVLSKDSIELKDEELDIPDEMPEDIADVQSNRLMPYERIHILSPSNAKRAIFIIKDILNKLKWSSSRIMEHELQHKKAKSGGGNREEEEIIKLPMALAIVKLLQKLPEQMLENNIQSIFIKVANFLKSPLISVRTEARDIISKITLAVGTTHLGTLLELLSTMLTRGIHVHVLISTVHTVLLAVKDDFKVGEIDKHIYHILKVCSNDLFGKASEEKEVAKLGHKAPEAKPSQKSYSTLRIVAQNITENSLIELLKPFKEIAETSHSKRTLLKVQAALQNISLGLGVNQNIPLASLLNFIESILSGTVEKLIAPGQKRKNTDQSDREKRYKELKPDCFIIPPDPKGRKGVSNKKICNSIQANSHVILEFGLTLLHTVLQNDKISEETHKGIINSCAPCLVDSLKSPQVKVAIVALKCVTTVWSKRLRLPIIESQIENMTAMIFQILHKFSTTGISKKDDNFHLVSNAFKAVTALIREVKYHTINTDQMKALLLYAEHDINHHDKQATAFSLLKTIIGAKYHVPEIHTIMKKVGTISIQSENPRTREESRSVMLVFIMNYPLGKKLLHHIQFYLNQLSYELDHGRQSAIQMLQTFIDKFTEDVLNEHASLMYLSIGMRLVNDSSTDCKILIAQCLEQLITRVSAAKKNELFKINMTLFQSYKPPHVEMASQLCSRFVNVEKQSFKSRLETLLPELASHLCSGDTIGRCVKVKPQNNNQNYEETKDNSYIQVLMLLSKICEAHPTIFNDSKCLNAVDEIACNCQALLGHSHAWVRLNAAKYLAFYLAALDVEDFVDIFNGKKESERTCFYSHTALKSLVLDLSSQLIPATVSADMADVVCGNLMSLLKLATFLSNDNESENHGDVVTVFWIVRVMKSSLNSEVTKAPGTTVIRMSLFKSLENTLPDLKSDTAMKIAKLLLPCVVREMGKTDASADVIKEQAVKVGQLLSESLGDVLYNDLLTKVQAKLHAKKNERKQKIAQDKISNPEKAAKRKEVLKEKKKDYKRKRVDILKGRMKRPKLSSASQPMMTD